MLYTYAHIASTLTATCGSLRCHPQANAGTTVDVFGPWVYIVHNSYIYETFLRYSNSNNFRPDWPCGQFRMDGLANKVSIKVPPYA